MVRLGNKPGPGRDGRFIEEVHRLDGVVIQEGGIAAGTPAPPQRIVEPQAPTSPLHP